MALALNNAQGEQDPLEVGLHAMNSGLSVRDYAEWTGQSRTAIGAKRAATTVIDAFPDIGTPALYSRWSQLAEIHAAPRWIWHALVSALIDLGWTVEAARKAVKALDKVPKPPAG